MRTPRTAILLFGVLLGCAGKNPSNPDHRRSAEEQEAIDNICGAEVLAWKQAFADDPAVLASVRQGSDPAAGRALMRQVAADPRPCDVKTYRVCRICMELEDTRNCPQLQGGMLEFCLEKSAGVSDENVDAPADAAEPEAPAEPAAPAEPEAE